MRGTMRGIVRGNVLFCLGFVFVFVSVCFVLFMVVLFCFHFVSSMVCFVFVLSWLMVGDRGWACGANDDGTPGRS